MSQTSFRLKSVRQKNGRQKNQEAIKPLIPMLRGYDFLECGDSSPLFMRRSSS
jgi:hypothetical protein